MVRQQSAGREKAHPHFFLGKLRPRGVACPEVTPSVSSAQTGCKRPALRGGGSGEREGGPFSPLFSIA